MEFNLVDFIVLVVLAYFVWQGYLIGLIGSLLNLLTTIISLLSASLFYPSLGKIFAQQFGSSEKFSFIIAFFTILIVLELVFSLIATLAYKKIISPLHIRHPNLSRLDHIFGTVPAGLVGAIIVTLFLLLFILLPINENLRQTTNKSWWGRSVLVKAIEFEPALEKYLNRLPYQNLFYLLTPSPSSQESIKLPLPSNIHFTTDTESEKQMLSLVNKERSARGLEQVEGDLELTEVGRKHCLDMFERSYFSHYTPEGKSPFDRIQAAGIEYTYAGENLAYAPTVETAQQGLMGSQGHRENILRAEFGRLGVGVIDGGFSGKMFCQEFRD